jgi:Polyketide cyclase / dehydrase and lipid transport
MAVSVNPADSGIGHDGGMTSQSWHISERIDRPANEVYGYVSNPANVPRWAPGLGNSVEQVDGQWFVDTPAERVRLAFAPRNDLGVLDHYLTLTSGEVIYVPMRVIADEGGSEVVFTVRRRPGMTDAEFSQDGAAVSADLARLKRVLEDER